MEEMYFGILWKSFETRLFLKYTRNIEEKMVKLAVSSEVL
jgi:hypothetical protein